MPPDHKLRGVTNVDETRLWKALDTILSRLTGVESELKDLIRLQERVDNHDDALRRYGKRLDTHDSRIREAELWQAHYGDKESVERLVANVQGEVKSLKGQVDDLQKTRDIGTGSKIITLPILKWVSAILLVLLAWQLKRG